MLSHIYLPQKYWNSLFLPSISIAVGFASVQLFLLTDRTEPRITAMTLAVINIIFMFFASYRLKPQSHVCVVCGYSLHDSEAKMCPECGSYKNISIKRRVDTSKRHALALYTIIIILFTASVVGALTIYLSEANVNAMLIILLAYTGWGSAMCLLYVLIQSNELRPAQS